MGSIIQFPGHRAPDVVAMAEAVAELLAQASTEVSRGIYSHERSNRHSSTANSRGLYEMVRDAVEAADLDARAVLARMDAVTQEYRTGGIA